MYTDSMQKRVSFFLFFGVGDSRNNKHLEQHLDCFDLLFSEFMTNFQQLIHVQTFTHGYDPCLFATLTIVVIRQHLILVILKLPSLTMSWKKKRTRAKKFKQKVLEETKTLVFFFLLKDRLISLTYYYDPRFWLYQEGLRLGLTRW